MSSDWKLLIFNANQHSKEAVNCARNRLCNFEAHLSFRSFLSIFHFIITFWHLLTYVPVLFIYFSQGPFQFVISATLRDQRHMVILAGMLFVCLRIWHKNVIHMKQTVVFFKKRKYSNHTLKFMSVKHRYIENMTFISRLERTRARTHANIETKERS